MDNINVVRVGFLSPSIKMPDTNGNIDDPIDRTGAVLTALVFINPNETGAALINSLESGLPKTSSGQEVKISVITPGRFKSAKAFREKLGFRARLFCDADLRFGQSFGVIDSSCPKPSYHPAVFVIGDEGSVRYRMVIANQDNELDQFNLALSQLI